nr:immunoglobulin heavy chain junction region [Macaca mulatta]
CASPESGFPPAYIDIW